MKFRAIGTVAAVIVLSMVISSPGWADSITPVSSLGALDPSGIANLGVYPAQADVPSGTSIGVTGIPSLSVTITDAAGNDFMRLDQCVDSTSAITCPVGWGGNFAANTPLLWTNGVTDASGNFIGNGPVTLALNTPEQGIGFQINSDFYGTFSATLCAFTVNNTSLGCSDFTGLTANGNADNTAPFVGLFDTTGANIAKLTVSTAGDGDPNDFAISSPLIATPEPGTLLSLAAGLAGLAIFGLRKKSLRLSN